LTGGAPKDHFAAIAGPRREQDMAQPPPYARHREGGQPPYLYPDYDSTEKRAPTRPPIHFYHTLS
jgi:hypothetical protein